MNPWSVGSAGAQHTHQGHTNKAAFSFFIVSLAFSCPGASLLRDWVGRADVLWMLNTYFLCI